MESKIKDIELYAVQLQSSHAADGHLTGTILPSTTFELCGTRETEAMMEDEQRQPEAGQSGAAVAAAAAAKAIRNKKTRQRKKEKVRKQKGEETLDNVIDYNVVILRGASLYLKSNGDMYKERSWIEIEDAHAWRH